MCSTFERSIFCGRKYNETCNVSKVISQMSIYGMTFVKYKLNRLSVFTKKNLINNRFETNFSSNFP